MKHLLAFLAAFTLAGCFTPTGGSPLNAYGTSTGKATLGYDLNTFIVVYDGEGRATLRDALTKMPVYPAVEWSGSGVLVKVHSDDGDEKYSQRFELGDPLPAWLEPYAMAVFSLAEINELGLTFIEP